MNHTTEQVGKIQKYLEGEILVCYIGLNFTDFRRKIDLER